MDTDTLPTQRKNRKGLIFILFILLLIVGGVVGAYLYNSQHKKAQNLSSAVKSLNYQLQTLDTKLAAAQSATNISISSWKSYCDPYQADFCFKYPADWILTDNSDSQFKYAEASLTNPAKTLTMTYTNPYLKDGFPANFIVNSGSSLSVDGNNLTVLGGYYVEAVEHTPIYAITNIPVSSAKQGQTITFGTPVFQYANNSSTAEITISPTQNFPTTAQANAWFNSVNGKTALAVMKSLYSN